MSVVCLSVCLSVCICVYQFVCLSIHLFGVSEYSFNYVILFVCSFILYVSCMDVCMHACTLANMIYKFELLQSLPNK